MFSFSLTYIVCHVISHYHILNIYKRIPRSKGVLITNGCRTTNARRPFFVPQQPDSPGRPSFRPEVPPSTHKCQPDFRYGVGDRLALHSWSGGQMGGFPTPMPVVKTESSQPCRSLRLTPPYADTAEVYRPFFDSDSSLNLSFNLASASTSSSSLRSTASSDPRPSCPAPGGLHSAPPPPPSLRTSPPPLVAAGGAGLGLHWGRSRPSGRQGPLWWAGW